MHTFLLAIARGWALTLGGFILLNLVGQQVRTGFDANLWWIDLRALPATIGDLLLLVTALALVAFALRPVMSRRRRLLSMALITCVLCGTLANAITFWRLVARGDIASRWPVPLSLLTAFVLVGIVIAVMRTTVVNRSMGSGATGRGGSATRPVSATRDMSMYFGLGPSHGSPRRTSATRGTQDTPRRSIWVPVVMLGSIGFMAAAFPIMQMLCFGSTDYARRADVAIVLGARAYADGTASAPLEDRVRTACDLYRTGQVRWLLMTGGPGDGDIHETEAMRRLAMQLGVPADRILRDEHGVNTEASAEQTTKLLELHGFDRALVVSHGYHLPRVKLAYQRQGVEVFTVPAKERHRLRAKPVYVAREIAAMWWYYLSPLWS